MFLHAGEVDAGALSTMGLGSKVAEVLDGTSCFGGNYVVVV
jgi:hypothetical protein